MPVVKYSTQVTSPCKLHFYIVADDIWKCFLSSEKWIRYFMQTCMKWQILFSGKNRKKILNLYICKQCRPWADQDYSRLACRVINSVDFHQATCCMKCQIPFSWKDRKKKTHHHLVRIQTMKTQIKLRIAHSRASYMPRAIFVLFKLSMSSKKFSRRQFELLLTTGIWHFMQIVSSGDNLHELLYPTFWAK